MSLTYNLISGPDCSPVFLSPDKLYTDWGHCSSLVMDCLGGFSLAGLHAFAVRKTNPLKCQFPFGDRAKINPMRNNEAQCTLCGQDILSFGANSLSFNTKCNVAVYWLEDCAEYHSKHLSASLCCQSGYFSGNFPTFGLKCQKHQILLAASPFFSPNQQEDSIVSAERLSLVPCPKTKGVYQG